MSFRVESAQPPYAPAAAVTAVAAAALTPFGFVRRAVLAIDRRRRVNAAIEALSALDDHLLHDVGLTRARIGEAAHDIVEQEDRIRWRW